MTTTQHPPAPPTTPKLSEVARALVRPDGIVSSNFPRVYARLQAVGVTFDTWQQGFGSVALGCRESGTYAATVGGVVGSLPRQVGKTYTVGNLLIGLALEFPNTRIVWTSHHNRTTTNTFRSMQGMVRRKKIRPLLAANGIRTANGEQEIRFANGSIIMFGAREHGFGRGMDAIDVLVFDEAQILSLKALEDMVPATNQARHPHGALVFFIGTPPRPTDDGEAFRAKRDRALSGKSTDMFYVELGAEPEDDPDDRSVWTRMNPSYPSRTPLESMLRMRENIPDEGSWSREAMGRWDKVKTTSVVVPAETWEARRVEADAAPAPDSEPAALAVDRWHDGSTSIAAAWRTETGWHVELVAVDVTQDTSQVVEWIAARTKGRRIPVTLAGDAPAAALTADLKSAGARVITATVQDVGKACVGFLDDVKSARLTHGDQQQLNDALAAAKKKSIGQAGAWGWDRKSAEFDISPLMAATLARFGAVVSQRKKTGPEAGSRVVVLS